MGFDFTQAQIHEDEEIINNTVINNYYIHTLYNHFSDSFYSLKIKRNKNDKDTLILVNSEIYYMKKFILFKYKAGYYNSRSYFTLDLNNYLNKVYPTVANVLPNNKVVIKFEHMINVDIDIKPNILEKMEVSEIKKALSNILIYKNGVANLNIRIDGNHSYYFRKIFKDWAAKYNCNFSYS